MIQIPKKTADCKVNLEHFKEHLMKFMSGVPHRELICRVIIAHLSKTEVGISHLFSALAGMEVEFKYTVGTKVLISVDRLPSWRIDKDKTLEHTKTGPAYGYCIGVIKDIDPFVRYPYRCAVELVSAGVAVEVQEHLFAEEDIFPEETIDQLVKIPEPPF